VRILVLGDNRSFHTYRFFKAYKEKGVEVLCYGLEKGESLCPEIPVKGGRRTKYLLAVPSVKKIVKNFNPDFIHAHMAGNYGLVALLTGIPYILSLWGPDIVEFPFKSPLHFFLTKLILKKASLIHTDSQFALWILEKCFRVGRDKVMVFPFGISRPFFRGEVEKFREFPVIFSHRKLEQVYGHEVTIKALKILKDQGIDFKFYLASFGSEEGRLKKLVKELKLEERVFFTGKLEEEELASLMAKCHIFVSSAFSDTTPNSLLEAMALYNFPILSDLPVYREWIVDRLNGLFYKVGDPEDLASKLKMVIEDWEKFKLALHYNRRIAEEKASWEANFSSFLEKLEELRDRR